MKLKLLITALVLLFVNGCDSAGTTPNDPVADDPVEKVAVGWYMRTIATATASDGTEYIHQTAGVFGELEESNNEKDRHDIASYKTGILQIVFVPEWESGDTTYFSDYRSYDNAQKQVWTFQVKNQRDINLANADLTLSIKGVYDVYRGTQTPYEEELSDDNSKKMSLTLLDIDNQIKYSYEELKIVNLSMDGVHTRTFRWVLGSVDAEDMQPLQTKIVDTREAKVSGAIPSSSDLTFKSSEIENGTFGLPPE